MSAVMEPRCTSTWSTSTAVMPPKVRRTESATRIGSGFFAPGTGSTVASAAFASAAYVLSSASIERHLLPVAERALRAEHHQQDEHEADEHEPERAHLAGAL